MKKALIILLCVLLIGGGGYTVFSVLRGMKFKNDVLLSCAASTGGGMLGGSYGVSLQRDENGRAILRVRQKETHADREITTEYIVSNEAFAHVSEIVNACDLYGASRRRYSKIQVLDGETTTVSFDFAKGDFRVSGEQVMSGKMRKGFREVIDYLNSLAVGEGTTTMEAQRAVLYLRSGYTLQFTVEDAFDGKLDAILSEERDVSAFKDCGIVLAANVRTDVSAAASADSAATGDILYDPAGEQIILLYADAAFAQPVYVLARLNGYAPSASPLIAEMEGAYSLSLN